MALLKEFVELFAWSYIDMLGLDTNVMVHGLLLNPRRKLEKAQIDEAECFAQN